MIKKVLKGFDEIDVNAGAQKNTGDELLDLMDDLWFNEFII